MRAAEQGNPQSKGRKDRTNIVAAFLTTRTVTLLVKRRKKGDALFASLGGKTEWGLEEGTSKIPRKTGRRGETGRGLFLRKKAWKRLQTLRGT